MSDEGVLSNVSIPFFTPEQLKDLPHDDLGPRLDGVDWILTSLATAFLVLRVYCKFSRRGSLWWDDWILVAAWAALVVSSSINSASVKLGYGKHFYDIIGPQFSQLLLLGNISGTFAILAAVWSKTSFAVTLLRVTQGWTKLAVWLAIISMNVAMHLTAVVVWTNCSPVEKSWNFLIEGSCSPIERLVEFNMFSAAYSATMDILLALLPWKIVWAAKLKRSEALGVAFAMSMGLFAGITAFVKVSQVPRMKSGDIYDGVELTMWSTAEISITILAASVPILRTLLGERKQSSRSRAHYLPKYRLSSTDNFEMQSRSTVIIEAGHGDTRNTSNRKEDILQSRTSFEELQPPRTGAIIRTSIVTVVWEEPKEQKP